MAKAARARLTSLIWPAALTFALWYGLLRHVKHGGWVTGICTLILGLLVWALYQVLRHTAWTRKMLAYGVFFVTPVLTLTGQIGVLTGFGGTGSALPWLGVAFVSAGLAAHVWRGQLDWRTLLLAILHPLRWNSGPCALPGHMRMTPPWRTRHRARVYLGWIVLGAFFFGVLAAGIAPLLALRQSTDALDILVFATLFEAYVYFNFAGVSFMVYGSLRLCGVPCLRNFNTPFAARDVIQYWQRWHMSLSGVLKILFFQPLKQRFGVGLAVLVVFLCSALWHGVSGNFVLWGCFHAGGWLLAWWLASSRLAPPIGRGISAVLLAPVIIIGRLIFSESDSELLRLKLLQLARWQTGPDAWVTHLTIDDKTAICLALGGACILAEIICPKRHRAYKLLRGPTALVLLLGLIAWLGKTGLGSVYGTR